MQKRQPDLPDIPLLSVVRFRPDLARGTIVEQLDEHTVLVEFADAQGHTLLQAPVDTRLLAVLPIAPRPLLDVVAVEPLPGFVLRITFENGEIRRFSLARLLSRQGTVFTPLRKVAQFQQAYVAHGTVCWPGGADVDPELLYEQSVPESHDTLADRLAEMPDVGTDEDFCRQRIGIAKGQFNVPDEPMSGYPIDADWDEMPDVGWEKWPDNQDLPTALTRFQAGQDRIERKLDDVAARLAELESSVADATPLTPTGTPDELEQAAKPPRKES